MGHGEIFLENHSIIHGRGHRLLEFSKTNYLIAANTFGPHKNTRIQTLYIPGGLYHNQSDYIFMNKCFSTSVNLN